MTTSDIKNTKVRPQSPKLSTFKVAQEWIPSLAGRYYNPIWLTGPPGYKGWRNRFLGSLNVYKLRLWFPGDCYKLHPPQVPNGAAKHGRAKFSRATARHPTGGWQQLWLLGLVAWGASIFVPRFLSKPYQRYYLNNREVWTSGIGSPSNICSTIVKAVLNVASSFLRRVFVN